MKKLGIVTINEPAMSDPDVLRYADAAKLIGVAVPTMHAFVHERRVPHFRLSARLVIFRRSDLLAWLESRRVPVGSTR
jgi:excisionase family DNA binding protein